MTESMGARVSAESGSGGVGDEVRGRVRRLFEFLKRFDERRTPIRRNVEDASWKLSFAELPAHPTISSMWGATVANADEADRPVLSIQRAVVSECPNPPSVLEGWLVDGWRDVEAVPDYHAQRTQQDGRAERFDADRKRAEALNEWLKRRKQWAAAEIPARQSLGLFNRCMALWAQLQREGEALRVLVGDGHLVWLRPDDPRGAVRHPLVLLELELQFDEKKSELSFVEVSSATFLYSELLSTFEDLDGNRRQICRSLVEQASDQGTCHPLGGRETEEVLVQLGRLLGAADGLAPLGKELQPDATPRVQRNPVIFVVPRQSGVRGACEALLSRLDGLESLPVGLELAVGAAPSQQILGGADDPSDVGEDVELFFTKPANEAQERIAQRLERKGAVLVQGPPGTGKTHTIANLIGHLLAQGKSVLITAQTSKALRVLREKVVDELKPLCVSVLDSDLESRSELEHAVNGIVTKLTSDKAVFDSMARALRDERRSLKKRIGEKTRELKTALTAEIEDVVVSGKGTHPSEAARTIARGLEANDWLPGEVVPGAPLSLSSADLSALYGLNAELRREDELLVLAGIPKVADLILPTDFRAVAVQLTAPLPPATDWRFPAAASLDSLRTLNAEVSDALGLLARALPWVRSCIHAGLVGGDARKTWVDFEAFIDASFQEIAGLRRQLVGFDVTVDAALDVEEAAGASEAMATRVAAGGGLSWFSRLGHKDWTRTLAGSTVNGKRARSNSETEALRNFLRVQGLRVQVRRRWDGVMTDAGLPLDVAYQARPEEHAHALLPELRQALGWAERWEKCAATMRSVSVPWTKLLEATYAKPPHAEVSRISKCAGEQVVPAIDHELEARRRSELVASLEKSRSVLSEFKRVPAAAAALRALESKRDADAYEVAFRELDRLDGLRDRVKQHELLLASLRTVANGWSEQVSARRPPHAGPNLPGDVEAAWQHRQFTQELDRRARLDPDTLQRELSTLNDHVQTVTRSLVENLSWAAQAKRTSPAEHAALTAWAQFIRRIGKGTGKRAEEHRREARKQLDVARGAVPVWIMPLARVAESFLPGERLFDVVILDEASQCDISALVAFALGRQVVVVGDDEQVSPLDIGQNVLEVRALQEEWLQGFTDQQLFDGRASAYEIAGRRFPGGLIRLVEHFRCVPDIIAFSNDLSYKNEIKPLRESSSAQVFPAVIPHRVLGGERVDRAKTNRIEALEVASLAAAMTKVQSYQGLEIGVVSLLGDEQAREIDGLLQKLIDPSEYKKRRIICGTAAHFQGDERHVMLLSMVDSPEEGPLRLLDQDLSKKRYNVAASRARDQLWVVHSVDADKDLKPGDLRRRLLTHALNPTEWRRRLEGEGRTESEFERRVLRQLTQDGFAVRPQVEVGAYRLDLVVEGIVDGRVSRIAIECDGERYHTLANLDADLARQAILERLGWRFIRIRGSAFFRDGVREMARVTRRLGEFGINAGSMPSGDAPSNGGTEHRDEVIRVAAELRRSWLDDAGSIDELFARAAPTKRGRTYGRKPTADAKPTPVAVGENAAVVHQRLGALERGLQSAKHKVEEASAVPRQAALPIDVASTTAKAAPRQAVLPIDVASTTPKSGPVNLTNAQPPQSAVRAVHSGGDPFADAILGQLATAARVCARCGRSMKFVVDDRAPFLQCEMATCTERVSPPIKALRDAVAHFDGRCDCGSALKIVEYGPARFVACSAHPDCKKQYPWRELKQRLRGRSA